MAAIASRLLRCPRADGANSAAADGEVGVTVMCCRRRNAIEGIDDADPDIYPPAYAPHPLDFPSSAHFSPLIGATHTAEVGFWREGGAASDGIIDMAERGLTMDAYLHLTAFPDVRPGCKPSRVWDCHSPSCPTGSRGCCERQ